MLHTHNAVSHIIYIVYILYGNTHTIPKVNPMDVNI